MKSKQSNEAEVTQHFVKRTATKFSCYCVGVFTFSICLNSKQFCHNM